MRTVLNLLALFGFVFALMAQTNASVAEHSQGTTLFLFDEKGNPRCTIGAKYGEGLISERFDEFIKHDAETVDWAYNSTFQFFSLAGLKKTFFNI